MMEKYFALIKNNIVEGVVVGNDAFLSQIQDVYSDVVDVTDRPRPAAGDSYYKDTDSFISNTVHMNHIPVDMSADHLLTGTEEGFEPFQLSQYSVKYENGVITIGCKKYSAPGLLDALHKVLIEDHQTTSHFTQLEDGPTHGKFGITWDDAQKLYDALVKVRF